MEQLSAAHPLQNDPTPSTPLGTITVIENGRQVQKEVHVVFTNATGDVVAAPRHFQAATVASEVNKLAKTLIETHTQSEYLQEFYQNRTVTDLTRQGVVSTGGDGTLETKMYNRGEKPLWQKIEDLLLCEPQAAQARPMTRYTTKSEDFGAAEEPRSRPLHTARPSRTLLYASDDELSSSGDEVLYTPRERLKKQQLPPPSAAGHDEDWVDLQSEFQVGAASARRDPLWDEEEDVHTRAHAPLASPLQTHLKLTNPMGTGTTVGGFFRKQAARSASARQSPSPTSLSAAARPPAQPLRTAQLPGEGETFVAAAGQSRSGFFASKQSSRRVRAQHPHSDRVTEDARTALPTGVRLELRPVAGERHSPPPPAQPMIDEDAGRMEAQARREQARLVAETLMDIDPSTGQERRFCPPPGHPNEGTENKSLWMTQTQITDYQRTQPQYL